VLAGGKFIARGGFWDGRISICPVEGDLAVNYTNHSSTVIALSVNKQEDLAISGTKNGEVIVWEVQEQYWSFKKLIFDHESEVHSICISDNMGLFVTAGQDGKCHLYSLSSLSWIRQVSHPAACGINSVVLSMTPLASVAFFSKSDQTWHSFSINGTLLESVKDETTQATSPIVVSDIH